MFGTKNRSGSLSSLSFIPNGKESNVQMMKIAPNQSSEAIPPHKKLTAVSMATVVENLTNEAMGINSFAAHALFTTYTSFTTPEKLLHALRLRFLDVNKCFINNNESLMENVKTFVTLISIWIDTYPEDFTENILSILSTYNLNGHSFDIRKHVNIRKNKMNKDGPISPSKDQLTVFKPSTCLIKVPRKELSEQLTLADIKLFTSLNLRDCLASNRRRSSRQLVAKDEESKDLHLKTMTTTKRWTNHFNNLVHKVIASVLKSTGVNHINGAIMVEKWIDIASELRKMKNFSSLKAIVSALLSEPIHRLSCVWDLINKSKLDHFKDLSNLCNYSSNFQSSRQLLSEDGSSTSLISDNTDLKEKDKFVFFKNNRKKSNYDIMEPIKTKTGESNSAIPYLGMFLTDLVMIDAAHPDPDDQNLINFEKRRKEFEILGHIRILQLAAARHRLHAIHGFDDWFRLLPKTDENEGYSISREIFPEAQLRCGARRCSEATVAVTTRLAACDSFSSTKSTDSTATVSSRESDDAFRSDFNHATKLKSRSMDSLDCLDGSDMDEETMIVRFYMQRKNGFYKSIKVKSEDRTRHVIEKVLAKFRINASIDMHSIQQCIDNHKSIIVPDNCNVFYALKRCHESIPECLLLINTRSVERQ